MAIRSSNWIFAWTSLLLLSFRWLPLSQGASKFDVEEDNGRRRVVACEGSTATLKCPEGRLIRVVRANYGRMSVLVCNEAGRDFAQLFCMHRKSRQILQDKCGTRSRCEILSDNRNFYDACPGIPKYLQATYKCVKTTMPTAAVATTEVGSTTRLVEDNNGEEGDDEEDYDELRFQEDESQSLSSVGEATVEVQESWTTDCSATEKRTISWPATRRGGSVKRPCPNDRTNTTKFAVWWCSEKGTWSEEEPDLSLCSSKWIENLQIGPHDSQAGIVEAVRRIRKHVRIRDDDSEASLFGGDLLPAVSTLAQSADRMRSILKNRPKGEQSHYADELNKELFSTVSELLARDENLEKVWKDLPKGKRQQTAASLIDALERSSLLAADFLRSTSSATLATKQQQSPAVWLELSLIDAKIRDSVTLPVNHASSVGDRGVTVVLPAEVIRVSQNAQGFSKVIFVSFGGRIKEYLEPFSNEIGEQAAPVERKLVSRIAGVVVGNGIPISDLNVEVRLTFAVDFSQRNMVKPQCVYWKKLTHQRGFWSSYGCRLLNHDQTSVSCACNHLTNFAVLMEVGTLGRADSTVMRPSQKHQKALLLVSYAGCSVSVVMLALAFVAFALYAPDADRLEFHSDRIIIHKNLCFTLLIGEAVFLVGIFQTQNKPLCSGIAAALHFFFLSAFCWMLLEGFQLYYMMVRLVPPRKSQFASFYMFAYGCPAMLVTFMVLVDWRSYGSEHYCWLRKDNYFALSFTAPVVLVLLANATFLMLTLSKVCAKVGTNLNRYQHISNSSRFQQAEQVLLSARYWVKGAVALAFLLGLTWSFGLLWLDDGTVVFAYIFIVLNSLQGLFIFVFYVVWNEQLRRQLAKKYVKPMLCLSDGSDPMNWPSCSVCFPGMLSSSSRSYKLSSSNSAPPLEFYTATGTGARITPNNNSCEHNTAVQNSDSNDSSSWSADSTEEDAESEYNYATIQMVAAEQQHQLPNNSVVLSSVLPPPPPLSPPPPPPPPPQHDVSEYYDVSNIGSDLSTGEAEEVDKDGKEKANDEFLKGNKEEEIEPTVDQDGYELPRRSDGDLLNI